MNDWFTVKVKYTKSLEDGTFKRVTEPYLVAAMSFTDAEARIFEEMGEMIRGEFDVTGISKTNLQDIFAYDDVADWYKCKMVYENMESDGKPGKKVSQMFLVAANNVKEAYERMQESLKGYMVDFELPSIALSPIIDIFPYSEDMDKELDRRPMTEDETLEHAENGNVVFSASGSDINDQEEVEESEVVDDSEE